VGLLASTRSSRRRIGASASCAASIAPRRFRSSVAPHCNGLAAGKWGTSAGVVDQDVEALIGPLGDLHHVLDVVADPDVGAHERGSTPLGLNAPRRLLALLNVTRAGDFPRQLARTRRFSLGVPGRFTVSANGRRVLFVRSGSAAIRWAGCGCTRTARSASWSRGDGVRRRRAGADRRLCGGRGAVGGARRCGRPVPAGDRWAGQRPAAVVRRAVDRLRHRRRPARDRPGWCRPPGRRP
jgi:hypothetical protein